MILLQQESGATITLGRVIAQGGEGKIYTIVENPALLAKIFHKPTPEKAAKLQAMLLNRPEDVTRLQGHISIAWPTSRIADTQGHYIGFLLPNIDYGSNSEIKVFPLLKIYNPFDRRQTNKYFTWEYLLRMATNLASVIEALHQKGYVIGDLNESNVLVTSTALVVLIDCDSIQVPAQHEDDGEQGYFPCTVGKPEYTPPELHGKDFSLVRRRKHHDAFSLAVLIFLMLMEGRHPFAGVWRGDRGQLTLEQSIRSGNFPYAYPRRLLTPPKNALPFNTLPPKMQRLMRRCFVTCSFSIGRWYPLAWCRPSARAWKHALSNAEKHLVDCERNNQHVYSDHLEYCPWCRRMERGIPDPFPPIRGIEKKVRVRKSRRKYYRRATRLSLPFFIVALYSLEIFFWHFYQQWLTHNTLQLQCVLLLCALVMPVALSFIIYTRLRSHFQP
jgi:DNA-binding helix-hairpin-helix protein with protein kinase domain